MCDILTIRIECLNGVTGSKSIDWLVFNNNISSISAVSWRFQVGSCIPSWYCVIFAVCRLHL